MNEGKHKLRTWEVAVIEGDYTRVVSVQADGYNVSEQGVLTFYCLVLVPDKVVPEMLTEEPVTVLCLATGMWRYFQLVKTKGEA